MSEEEADNCGTECQLLRRYAYQNNRVVRVLSMAPETEKTTTPLQQKPQKDKGHWGREAYCTFVQNRTGKNEERKQNITRNPIQRGPEAVFVEPHIGSRFKLDQPEDETNFPEAESRETSLSSSGPISSGSSVTEVNRDVELDWQTALRATHKTTLDILLDTSSVSDRLLFL